MSAGVGVNERLTRKQVLRLLAEHPGSLLKTFGIGRSEFLQELAAVGLDEMRKELGGRLVDWFPLSLTQASFVAGGASRATLLKGEHQNYGEKKKNLTLGQALEVKSRATKNMGPGTETPHERVNRLRSELAQAEMEVGL